MGLSGVQGWGWRGPPATSPGAGPSALCEAAGSAPRVWSRKPTSGTRVPPPAPRGGPLRSRPGLRPRCRLTEGTRRKEEAEMGLQTLREEPAGTRIPRGQAEQGPCRWPVAGRRRTQSTQPSHWRWRQLSAPLAELRRMLESGSRKTCFASTKTLAVQELSRCVSSP